MLLHLSCIRVFTVQHIFLVVKHFTLVLQNEFLSQMGASVKSASWLSIAAASGIAALLTVLAGYAIQRFRIRQEMHNEIHEIM